MVVGLFKQVWVGWYDGGLSDVFMLWFIYRSFSSSFGCLLL
jgi:hypothetical protein